MTWRILRATATIGGWLLAALVLAYLERIVNGAPPGSPAMKDDLF